MTWDDGAAFFEALAPNYVVERRLGRGGMATVYLARELRHRRPVALKVMRQVHRRPEASG